MIATCVSAHRLLDYAYGSLMVLSKSQVDNSAKRTFLFA